MTLSRYAASPLVLLAIACGSAPAPDPVTPSSASEPAQPATLLEVLAEPEPAAHGLVLAAYGAPNPACVDETVREGDIARTRDALRVGPVLETCVVEYRVADAGPGNDVMIWGFLFATEAEAETAMQSSRLNRLAEMFAPTGLAVERVGRLVFYMLPEGNGSAPHALGVWPGLRERVRAYAPLHVDEPRPPAEPAPAVEPLMDSSCSEEARRACQMRATDGMSCHLTSAGCGPGGARCRELRVGSGCACRCDPVGAPPPA